MDMLTIGVLCFAAGVVAGAGVLFWLLPARRQAGQLIRDRDEARQALNHYRDQVDDHFLHTAELVNDLTQAYQSVHEHLSLGARELCSQVGHKRAAAKSLDAQPSQPDDEEGVTPPLDYAPKAKGTLSEDFGLRADDSQAQSDTAAQSESDVMVAPPRDYAEGCEDQGCPPGDEKK